MRNVFPPHALVLLSVISAPTCFADDPTGSDGNTLLPTDTVIVSPDQANLDLGESLELTAIPFGPDGQTLMDRPVVWAVANPNVAEVLENGDHRAVVQARNVGSTNVFATSGDVSGSASIAIADDSPTAREVTIRPASARLQPGQTQQFRAYEVSEQGDSTQLDASFSATGGDISSNGLYTAGSTPGDYRVIASGESGLGDTASVTISSPSPPPGGAPDPTLLPVATGQTPGFGSYEGRSLSAGDWYADPASGVTVFKLCDRETPISNERCVPDYASGSTQISLPHDGIYTIYLQVRDASSTHYLVDFDPQTGEVTNWRQPFSMTNRELQFTFSHIDPCIAYAVDMPGSDVLRRFDICRNEESPQGNFPETFPVSDLEWVQQDKNDEWFVMQDRSKVTTLAWNSQTDELHTWQFSQNDEPHIDREGNWVMSVADRSCYGGEFSASVWGNLNDGSTLQPSPNTPWPCDKTFNSHGIVVQGVLVGHNPHETRFSGNDDEYQYDPATDELTFFQSRQEMQGGSGHRAGQWVVNNPGWYLLSAYDGTQGANVDRAIAFVPLDGSEVRLLAHHYSESVEYYDQPHANISPDGKLVVWGSNMGGGDPSAFVAIVPGAN